MPSARDQLPANPRRIEIMHAPQSDLTVSTASNDQVLRGSLLQAITDLDAAQKRAEQNAAAALDKVARYTEAIRVLRITLPVQSDPTVSMASNDRKLRRSLWQAITNLREDRRRVEQDAAAALDKVARYTEAIRILKIALLPQEPVTRSLEAVKATAALCKAQDMVAKDTFVPQEICCAKEGLHSFGESDREPQQLAKVRPKRRRLEKRYATSHEDEDESEIVQIR